MTTRVVSPGVLHAELEARLAATRAPRKRKAARRARSRSPLAVLTLLTAFAVFGAAVATAVHDLDLFELDRNAVDGAAAGEDWDKVFAGTDTAVVSTFVPDAPPDGSIFTTGGSKDHLDVSSWRHTAGNVPDKDEITNAYAAAYDDHGDLIIYFGLDRFANNGDAQVGFWFFHQQIGLNPDGTFNGVHQVGDILVLSHFTNGGAISNIEVYRWVGSGGDTNGTLDHIATGAECGSASGDNVCAIVNNASVTAPWPYTPKSGPAGSFPSGSFYEGGIDLGDLGLDLGCGGSFLAETRSSQSVDAQLKDFALGSFDLCGDITAVKYLDVNGNGADDGEERLTGWTMELYEDENGNGTIDAEDDLLDSGLTAGADGSVTFTDLEAGDYIVCEVLQTGWVNTDPGSGLCKPVELSTAGTETVEFGNGDPDIDITKEVDQDTICAGLDTTVTYTFEVTNTGNVDLTNVDIDDDVLGNITADFMAENGGSDTLAAGDSVTFTVDHTLSATTTNEVTATGDYATVSPAATATADATVTAVDCDIEITKDVDSDTICAGSETEVTYTFTVSNPGDVDLTNVVISDDQLGDLTDEYETAHGGNTLAAGDSETFMVNATLSATTTNIVTASGDALGHSPADTDTATATVTAVECAISIEKEVDQDTICEGLDTEVTYTFTVSNPGDVALDNVTVDDDQLGDLTSNFTTANGGSDTLAAGGSVAFDVSVTLSASVTNTVTATGEALGVTATDMADATVTAVTCDIEITKEVDNGTICADSDTLVTYTFVVSNPGDADLTNVSIIDDVLGDITGDYETAHGGNTLAAGDSETFTVSHTLSATTTNTVEATGDALGQSPADSDTATAMVTAVDCTISITKDVSDTEVCAGDTVTYTYVVHNNSTVFTWTGDITDDNGTPADTSDDFTVASGVVVGPGADSTPFTHDSVIGLGTVTNTATADGDFDDAATTTATATDDATTTGINCGGGCTPGFWQGGFGAQLWNVLNDPDWAANGGVGTNPFAHDTLFNDFFTDHSGLNGKTMLDVVGTGGGNQWYRKAARDVVAAYLNASFGIGYPFTTTQIAQMWTDAVNAGNNSGFMQIHADLGPANELGCTIGQPTASGFPIAGIPLLGAAAGAMRRLRRRRRG